MTGRTHDMAAVTALSVVLIVHPPATLTLSTAIIALIANLIGGITPDIDQPTAPLWRNLPVGKYFGKVFDTLSGGHRFLTHSILGMTLFGFLAHWLLLFLHPIMPNVNTNIVWVSFMIGMASHLVMDTITKEGVPWFLPVPYKIGLPPIKSLRITTGKAVETWIVFPALLIFNLIFISHHYKTILDILHKHVT